MSLADTLVRPRRRPQAADGGAPVLPAPPARRRGLPGRLVRILLALAVVAAGVLVSLQFLGGSPTYALTAVFSRAPGLFPGAAVDVLGVKVGTVTSVRNVGSEVVVGLQITQGQRIPAAAVASLRTPDLLGEPDIDLTPGYRTGPALAPGAVIPLSRTSEPVSTEELLRQLNRTLSTINPNAVRDLVTNLADDLDGQGQALHQLIGGAAGTLQILADNGNQLGQLEGTLAQLTGTLDSRTAQIQRLLSDYDTVSGVLAAHSSALADAINQLTSANAQITQLLAPNLSPLEQDVGTITTVGRTLDRNLSSVDEVLAQSVLLFTGAHRAYDPLYNWINLNLQLPSGVTGAYLVGLVRDRLAGICRRILANHSPGLSPTQIQTLQACGNPSSGFFDPLTAQIPGILTALSTGQPPPTTPLQLLQQGLAEIPGAAQAANTGNQATPAPAAPAPSPDNSAPSPTPTTAPTSPASGGSGSASGSGSGSGSGTGSGCLLGQLLCSPGSGSSGSGSAPAPGLPGLLPGGG